MKAPFNMKLTDLRESKVAHLNPHLFEQEKPKSKYRNTKTEVDGIKFDSKAEADRYRELKILLKAGEIGMLELQKEYELNPGGTHSVKYVADFVYTTKEGVKIVEDVKGFVTAVYRRKRRLMKKVHGITIIEIKK
jgi:hypothetical protein